MFSIADSLRVGGGGSGAAAGIAPAGGPNLRLDAARFADLRGNPVPDYVPVVGQMVLLRADWSISGLTAAQSYVVRFSVDGVPLDSRAVQGQAGTSGGWWWYLGGWYASPGPHAVQVTVDGAGAIAEMDESDNTRTFSFTPAAPHTLPDRLPDKFIQPIGGRPYEDWRVVNHADVDPRRGVSADYRGGPFQYDGHDAIDSGPGNFSFQDVGLSVNAAAPGTVVEVLDGNFDRQTTTGDRPGNFVRVDHGGGWQTLYYHFARDTVTVRPGDRVAAGQLLGLAGSSGSSTGTHLHFTVIRDGLPVETGYAPEAYWVVPASYAGDLPPMVFDSGVSNYNDFAEHAERVSGVDVFPTSATWQAYYWFHVANVAPTDLLRINWYRPNGSLAVSTPFTPPAHLRVGYLAFFINRPVWAASPGEWNVALRVNDVELDRQAFTVATGAGRPEIKVTRGGAVVSDGRTTPLDLGSVAAGGTPPQMTFNVLNHGAAPLALTGLQLPPGFSLVGAFPSGVAPGATASFTIRLDSARAGDKFGEVRFATNDADEGAFNFNVSGRVTGAAPAGSPTLALPGPAAAYWPGAPARVIDGTATLADADSPTFDGGTLEVEFAGHGTPDDRLALRHQGDAAGRVGVAGSIVRFGGTPVGTVSGGMGLTPLRVTFNAATRAAVEAVARNVTYAGAWSDPGTLRRYVRFTVTDGTGGSSNQPVKVVVIDNHPRPAVTGSEFLFAAAPHALRVAFTEAVAASLTREDATLKNVTTGQTFPSDAVAVAGGPGPNAATFTFPGVPGGLLPDGRYELTLSGPGVTDAAGNPLAADAVVKFFALRGDANRDGRVDVADLGILATNFNKTSGVGFAEGDFNVDARVDVADLGILATNFNTSLPDPPAQTAAFRGGTAALSPVNLFSAARVRAPRRLWDLDRLMA